MHANSCFWSIKDPTCFWNASKALCASFSVITNGLQTPSAWKVSKYGVTYFPVFSPNTGKYGPDKIP